MALTDKLTSIADAIRTKNGTSAKLSLDEMASSILAIESGSGIDTSDATATAENIESGYTAYVKGERITGSLETGVQTNQLANRTMYSNEGSVKYSESTGTGDVNLPSRFTVSYKNKYKRVAKVNDTISANVRASLFGNATVNDVVKGKTFSSENGLKLTGTYEGSTGLDTSDATATAGDIVSGKTAYVNAEKITGTLSTLNVAPGTPEYNTSPDQIKISTSLTERYIVENTVSLTAKASDFGDAVPSDVVSGKTFTSASGLKLTGTREESGGSSGGLVMKSGTTTSATIETGLSSIKMLVIYKTAFSTTGLMQGVYTADTGKMHYVYCSSYSSYIKSCNLSYSTACTVDGGTFTVGMSGTSGISTEIDYHWIAVGEA